MRTLFLILVAAAMAAPAGPAAAQLPISGLGNGPGSDNAVRQHWLGADDRPDRARDDRREVELGGQLRQLDRQIRRQRENGEISRQEARALRREIGRIAAFYRSYASDGLSDSEGAELQSRILALNSVAMTGRVPITRGH